MIRRRYVITCDEDGLQLAMNLPPQEAVEAATKAGWRSIGGRDLCPLCSVLAGQPIQLDAVQAELWDAITTRPARVLPGLRKLMDRPSPFGGAA